MPKPNTLTFPLSQTSIIFLGHPNSTMLHHFHCSYRSMSCTARHDASKVPIKPFLDSALHFSTVKLMQLSKLVPQKKNQIPSLANLTKRKFKKITEVNTTTPCWICWLRIDWELVTGGKGEGGNGWLFHAVFISDWFFWIEGRLV